MDRWTLKNTRRCAITAEDGDRGTITAYFRNSSSEDRGRDGKQPKSIQGRILATIRLLIPLDMLLGSIDRGKQSSRG